MGLAVRNLVFTVVVPGAGAVYMPWWILTRTPVPAAAANWLALILVVPGAALYLACLWLFATVGRGTPGPWDAPRHLVVVGPYRWVRNPIYVAAFLVVLGEAWMLGSEALLVYAVLLGLGVHLFVVGYEEPSLERSFGPEYAAYRHRVSRWLPRPPRDP